MIAVKRKTIPTIIDVIIPKGSFSNMEMMKNAQLDKQKDTPMNAIIFSRSK